MSTFKLTPDNDPNPPENVPASKSAIGDASLIAQAIIGTANKVCGYYLGNPKVACRRCGKSFAEHYGRERR